MTIKIRTRDSDTPEVHIGECRGLQTGDLVFENFRNGNTVKAIVVGYNSTGIWTVQENNVVEFRAGYLLRYNIDDTVELAERPDPSKIITGGLQQLLINFINKDQLRG